MRWHEVNSQLHAAAPVLEPRSLVRIGQYYQNARILRQDAEKLESCGEEEKAYVMYLRFVNVILKTLPKHKEYNLDIKQQKSFRSSAFEVLDILETLKVKLSSRWNQETPPNSPKHSIVSVSSPESVQHTNNDTSITLTPLNTGMKTKNDSVSDESDIDENFDNLRIWPAKTLHENNTTPCVKTRRSPTKTIPRASSNQFANNTDFSLIQGIGAYRQLHVPSDAPWNFLELVTANTLNNIETCGILGGALVDGELIITHIIIPKQKGSSDTVEATDVEQLCEFQFSHNLMTLGWIHTHPSQSCFLSSVDLHNQYGYQVMMPEAIAIVMAPSFKENIGTFSLTPKGNQVLSTCNLDGFHRHGEKDGLYEPSSHVLYNDNLNIIIIDLRQ